MLQEKSAWPFDMDLSSLDTGSITNILTDIEKHMPLVASKGGMTELLRIKKLFERELMSSHRLH